MGDPRGVLLTTYEHLRVMRDYLLPMRWGYAILDEAGGGVHSPHTFFLFFFLNDIIRRLLYTFSLVHEHVYKSILLSTHL